MKRRLATIMMVLVLFVQGCGTVVTAREQDLIFRNAENAVQMSELANRDPQVPDAYKRWIAADAKSWKALYNWSIGERATPKE